MCTNESYLCFSLITCIAALVRHSLGLSGLKFNWLSYMLSLIL
jgi:hypothetical protein